MNYILFPYLVCSWRNIHPSRPRRGAVQCEGGSQQQQLNNLQENLVRDSFEVDSWKSALAPSTCRVSAYGLLSEGTFWHSSICYTTVFIAKAPCHQRLPASGAG